MKNLELVLRILKENKSFMSVYDIQDSLSFYNVTLTRATLYKSFKTLNEMGFIFETKVSRSNKIYYKLLGWSWGCCDDISF